MFEQMTGDGRALALQRIDDAGEVDSIPVNDRAEHEIEAGGAKGLAVEGAVADLAALVKEDGALLTGGSTTYRGFFNARSSERLRTYGVPSSSVAQRF